ncbi:hypothetical protein KSP39_PZI020526 [Platanthera zijinensis]|uniref:Exocyst subunit Exo70 family protein n=1 Tax=Platanthera zijinensis TaxID=2320716 RepID=A0AAP0FXC7_9ASPA
MEGSDCTDAPPPPSAAEELDAAEKLILRWDPERSPPSNGMLFDGPNRAEAELYLRAVGVIRRPGTIQIAMVRLEDEFRHILVSRANPMDTIVDLNSLSLPCSRSGELKPRPDLPESVGKDDSLGRRISEGSNIREIDIFPTDAIHDLRSIADRMISAGYSGECFHVFSTVRKSAMELCLRNLNIERLSIGDVQRLDWQALESKIGRWIRAARVCVRIIFPGERRLCDLIFDTLAGDDSPFVDTVKTAAAQLLSFVDAISIIRRAPEKLFKFLDLHDALAELLPDFAIIFQSSALESINAQVSDIIARLAEAVRGILSEFENAILRDRSKIPVPGGTIHPLTRYVMNYTNLISDYRKTLLQLILSNPPATHPLFEVHFPEPSKQSPLASHLFWILFLLQFSIENTAQLYKDPALSHLFLMNNLHYIVQKVKSSPVLLEMIGDDYLKKLTAKYRQLATSYERSTWMKILNFLREEGLHVGGSFSSSSISKSTLRDRFKSFNGGFEEVHRAQATWLVPDPRLREELRISISAKLLPAYRSFLGRFRQHIESERHSEMYIKYSVEDLEMALSDFLEGCSPPSLGSRKSH